MRIFENLTQALHEVKRDLHEMGVNVKDDKASKFLIGQTFKILEVTPMDLLDTEEYTDKSQTIDSIMNILNNTEVKTEIYDVIEKLLEDNQHFLRSQFDPIDSTQIIIEPDSTVTIIKSVHCIKQENLLPLLLALNGLMVVISSTINFRPSTIAPYKKGFIYLVPTIITE